MTEYFYTVDLGETYGSKLQAMAVRASYADVEQFAAMILCWALDSLEDSPCIDDAAGGERVEIDDSHQLFSGEETDDGIPF
jgi:hypothetical protein